MDIKSEVN